MSDATKWKISKSVSDSRPSPSEMGRDSDHRGGPVGLSATAPVPLPVRSFIANGTCGDRRNVQAAFGFLQLELEKALGSEGTAVFRRIYLRLPRVFKSREACSKATIACWVEMWQAVEQARERKAA